VRKNKNQFFFIMKKLYKILLLPLVLTSLLSFSGMAQNAWINEFHYDDIGTDTNEFIEVIIENPGSFNLSDFSVILYNGNNGTTYDTKTLDLFTVGSTSGNFKFYYFMYPQNGIQNGGQVGGAPDGIALVYQDALIAGQFLSYEGTFMAADGPASGVTSVDIGVMEDNPVPFEGVSLQLAGSGTHYSSFAWQAPATATTGNLNNGQSLTGPIGIAENEAGYMQAYPNPTKGVFKMDNPSGDAFKITMSSLLGQVVMETMAQPGQNTFDLSKAGKGIYLIKISSQNSKFVKTQKVTVF
jgi:hypothetical protein